MRGSMPPKAHGYFPLILVLYEMANYLSNDAYLPALPSIAQEFGVSNHLVQLTLTTFFLGNATMQLILGPVSERYGRRPVLLYGGVVFVLSTFVCAFTQSIAMMLVARFIQGAAVTSMLIAGYGTIHALYDQAHAIKTLAWMSSITVLAPALGPLLGSFILLVASWRWIFIILAIWAMLLLCMLYKFTPETAERQASMHPIHIMKQYGAVLSDWKFAQPVLVMSFLFGAMIAWIAAGPFLVMENFHYSAQVFGYMQAIVFGSFIVGTYCVRFLMEKIGLFKLVRISLSLAFAGGALSIIFSFILPGHLFDIIAPLAILSLGSGIGFPIMNRLAIEANEQPMGIKMAVFASAMAFSALAGSAVISSFYDGKIISFAVILIIFGALALAFGYSIKITEQPKT